MRGNIADTRNIPNRSATEFHHDTCHDVPVSLRRLTVYMLVISWRSLHARQPLHDYAA
jgi:hypothetical protein